MEPSAGADGIDALQHMKWASLPGLEMEIKGATVSREKILSRCAIR